MKATLNQLTKALLIMVALVLSLSVVQAQSDLDNQATGVITNTGTIVFKKAGAKFKNANVNYATAYKISNDSGKIEFQNLNQQFTDAAGTGTGAPALGAVIGSRVPGVVLYSHTGAGQGIQDRYFSNLYLSGGTKSIPDNVYVGLAYDIAGGTGDRTYAGTFYYDGAATDTTAQRIYPESGSTGATNRYNNLQLQNDANKLVLNGETVNINLATNYINTATGTNNAIYGIMNSGSTFDQAAGANLHVVGATAALNLGTGASNLNAQVNIGTGGMVKTAGAGTATFAGIVSDTLGTFYAAVGDMTIASAGSLKLLNDPLAIVKVDASRTLTVTGIFTNAVAVGSRSNMVFDDASTTIYNSAIAQTVVATDTLYGYGNLSIAAAGQKTTENNVRFTGNYSVSDNDFLIASGHSLIMYDNNATVTYGADDVETIGRMWRYFNGDTDPLTFNNKETQITLTTNAASLTSLALDMQPGVEPGGNGAGVYRVNADVKRRTIFDYAQSASDWVSTVKLGFLRSESPSQDSLNTVRFKEIIPVGTPPTVEKIATGLPVTRDVAAGSDPLLSASLPGIKPGPTGTDLALVDDTHDIFLRGGPTLFITINSGRWSNPGTWDEGTEPTSVDQALVRHQVHTGFTRPNVDNYQTPEAFPTALASRITVEGGANTLSALLFGKTGTNAESPTNDFQASANAPIINNSGTVTWPATTLNDLTTAAGQTVAQFGGRGIIVYGGASLTAENFENTGAISNGGTIVVGK